MDAAATPADRLAADLRRTVDRFRGLALARLAAPFEPEPTRAEAARLLAQRLSDATADLSGTQRRIVPRLADAAVGDQLAVLGHDLLAAARDREPGDPVVEAELDRAAAGLRDLRRRV